MKIQGVILRAINKQVTWLQAAAINQSKPSSIETMANGVGEAWIRRVIRSPTGEAKPEASGARDCSGGAETIPREVCRVQCAAFPREAGGGTQDRVELHLGEEGVARSGTD